MKHKLVITRLETCLFILFIGISSGLKAQEEGEYCCMRTLMFPTFPMPEGQERNISGMISAQWNGMILHMGVNELEKCPHPIELRSWEGSLELDSMIERMTAAVTKEEPVFDTPDQARKASDYIWIGKLDLLRIDKTIPGSWEDAYIDHETKPGTKYYEPGYVFGRWRFTIKLFNPHWNEVVKEATTPEWDGSGLEDEPIANLFSQHFKNLKEIIWDYEQVPVRAELTPEKKTVESGERMNIKLRLYDDKNKPPKHWQRFSVSIKYGKLENAISCSMEGSNKNYIFLCADGQIDLRYVAPTKLNIKQDTIKIYNSCQTKHTSVVDLPGPCDEEILIGVIPIDITPAIIIHVRETGSGFVKGGDPTYPYNYIFSMEFKGAAINSSSIYQVIPKLPESLRSMVMKQGSREIKKDCMLVAELEPDEKSMKVERWENSDPVNNTPPPPLLAASPPNFYIPARIWQIEKKIYISHGFLDGIYGYFPGWDDPRSSNKKEPLGAYGPAGHMGEYIEVSYEKFINGETIILHPKDVSDHSKEDVWQYQTGWTVTINPN